MSESPSYDTETYKPVRPPESSIENGEPDTYIPYPELAESAAYESKELRDLIAKGHSEGSDTFPKFKEKIYSDAADKLEDTHIYPPNFGAGIDNFKGREIVEKYMKDGTPYPHAVERVVNEFARIFKNAETADYGDQVRAARAEVDKVIDKIRNRK
jgi:hypothetical protein